MNDWRTPLQNPTVLASMFTFLGVVIGSVLTILSGPRVQWGIEKRRDLRQHRRQLIADWRAMVGDVSKGLDEIEKTSNWHTGDALRLLERHAAYASFKSDHAQYSHSGVRGFWLRFRSSGVGRMIWRLRLSRYGRMLLGRLKLRSTPEYTLMVGSHLPARIHLTIDQIAEIERWWQLDK